MEKLLDTKQFQEVFESLNPKYLCLKDNKGEGVIGYNNKNTTPKAKLEQIKKYLNNEHTRDGIYIICTRDRNGGKGQVIEQSYHVKKGNHESSTDIQVFSPSAPQNLAQGMSNHILSYTEVLEKEKMIIDLQHQVKSLKDQVIFLEGELDEALQEPLADSPNNTMTFINKFMEQCSPLIDKILDQNDRRQDIREAELTYKIKSNPLTSEIVSQQEQQPEQEGHTDHNGKPISEEQFQYLCQVETYKENQPDVYNQLLTEFYNGGQNQATNQGS